MPELPEVHTTVVGLDAVLPGLEVTAVWSDWPRQIKSHGFEDFSELIIGKKFLSASRQAKNVLLHLSGGLTLRVHMKMTGHLMYGQWEEMPKGHKPHWQGVTHGAFDDPYNQYIHFMLTLSDSYQLALSDLRKFARIELLKTDTLSEHEIFSTFGPDVFDPELTSKIFFERLQKRPRAPIEVALMDQTIIAGIGHIYADETLWDAGILPTRSAKDITPREAGTILRSVRKIMTKSIGVGGDSKSDYRNIYGERGGFHQYHMAYHMHGTACTKRGCNGIIQRIKLGSRSAHFCPEHQH